MAEEEVLSALEKITANRRLVDELYRNGEISDKAREYALNYLYPNNQWSLWISRLMLAFGVAFILTGIVYFFAFNWAKITPLMKLAIIEIGMVVSIIGAYYFSLRRFAGQVFLLAASVLVGVFMAVFGQIYQSNADAYQFFMMWSLLIFPWTLISKFVTQWILWLVVTNVFLFSWWTQFILPSRAMGPFIFFYIALFNVIILALGEYLSNNKSYAWIQIGWTRILLVITISLNIHTLIAYQVFYMDIKLLGWILGIASMAALFLYYRYIQINISLLAIVVLFICLNLVEIIIDIFLVKAKFLDLWGASLIVGILSIMIFAVAVGYLRSVAHKIGGEYGKV